MENLKKQLEELKTKVNELEKAIEEKESEKENGDWKPELDEKYYFIDIAKDIMECEWENDDTDYFNLEKRNYYKTEDEAQFVLDMYNFCKERSFEPDWKDEKNRYANAQRKFFIILFHDEKKAVLDWANAKNVFAPFYYPNEEKAQEVIDKYSFEELEKYYGIV